jgi:hypothetical protein
LITKVIIITTALTRLEIHNIAFSNIHKFLKGTTVKWLINIDNFTQNDIAQKDTKQNFKKLLKYY